MSLTWGLHPTSSAPRAQFSLRFGGLVFAWALLWMFLCPILNQPFGQVICPTGCMVLCLINAVSFWPRQLLFLKGLSAYCCLMAWLGLSVGSVTCIHLCCVPVPGGLQPALGGCCLCWGHPCILTCFAFGKSQSLVLPVATEYSASCSWMSTTMNRLS